ncbi:MAG: hypothetical protein LRZ85_02810 [Alphaproteobacteria bacterium]|nr:hypothetical protein [Alphaproteobacteria bacterium]MCD8520286.1 hypothetical protein [Alphaproteobacteria bacterium]MCD8526246.1 hypothetical protein [Alphaproteobacteria bacterium]MCD8570195.1 hypothetical protein [Alphaproteobacteria bacterium]
MFKTLTLAVSAIALLSIATPAFAEHHEEMAPAATEEAAPAEVVETKLQDGTVVHIKGEEVFVVDAEGVETPAPDGEHTLEDGTVVKTMAGKVVHDDAAHEEHHEEAPAEEHAH